MKRTAALLTVLLVSALFLAGTALADGGGCAGKSHKPVKKITESGSKGGKAI